MSSRGLLPTHMHTEISYAVTASDELFNASNTER